MILTQKNGRRKSETTFEEVNGSIASMLANFTDDERKIARVLEEEMLGGGHKEMASEMKDHTYHTDPVSMEQFLDDPYYLGESCSTIYPAIREDLISLFERPYREYLATGGIGVGKSYCASIVVCRLLYEFSCMISPQKTLGLSSASTLVIPLISKNLVLARDVLKSAVDEKIKESPYFMTKCAPDFRKDYTLFPNNVRVNIGSYISDRILGTDVVSCVMDETNFPPKRKGQQIMTGFGQKLKSGHFDIVEKMYRGILRRIKSRFQKAGGGFNGMVILVSSAATTESFTERRIRERKDDPEFYLTDHTQWTAKPKENFSGEVFYVLCSTSAMKSRILKEEEYDLITDEYLEASDAFVMDIPIEFKDDFEANMEDALRDIAGFSTEAISQFIQRPKMITVCTNVDREHPFSKEEWISGSPGVFDWNKLAVKYERRLPGGYVEPAFRPRRNPTALRWCHIDTSLSGDCSGFSIGHVERWVDVVRRDSEGNKEADTAPFYIIDFMLRIYPPPAEQIYMPDLRTMLYQFEDHGFRFIGFSCDSYQCLAEGTRVITDRGVVGIEDVQRGDVVESRSGPNRVTNKWCFGERDTLRVTTGDGIVIEGTEKHRVEVLTGWNAGKCNRFYDVSGYHPTGGSEVWEWKRIGDLRVGDTIRAIDWEPKVDSEYVAMDEEPDLGPGGRGAGSDVYLSPIMDEKLAEWIGFFVGDGDIGNDGVRINCNASEIGDVSRITERAFGVKPSVSVRGNKGVVRISSRRLVRWLRRNGISKNKPLKVPVKIERSPKSVRCAFLRGLFGADGSVGKETGEVSLSTAYLELAESVAVIIRSVLGLRASISVMNRGHKGDYKKTGLQYSLRVNGSRRVWRDRIGFGVSAKMNALRDHVERKGRRLYSRVLSVEKSRAVVYDIEVENDPSYIANGIVSHNSAEMLQQVSRRGISSRLISMDRTTNPYDEVKSAFYENRIEIYPYQPFIDEFKKLEYDRLVGKIDHPEHGSKDCSDSVAGVVWGLKDSASGAPMEGIKEETKMKPHKHAWVSEMIPADEVDPEEVAAAKDGESAAQFMPMMFGDGSDDGF